MSRTPEVTRRGKTVREISSRILAYYKTRDSTRHNNLSLQESLPPQRGDNFFRKITSEDSQELDVIESQIESVVERFLIEFSEFLSDEIDSAEIFEKKIANRQKWLLQVFHRF